MTLVYNFQVASDRFRTIAFVDDVKICSTRQFVTHYAYAPVRLPIKVSSVVIIPFCFVYHCTSTVKDLYHVGREALYAIDMENIVLPIVVSRHPIERTDIGFDFKSFGRLTAQGRNDCDIVKSFVETCNQWTSGNEGTILSPDD